MRTGIIISALLEPISRRKPALIEENDLKLIILETLKEGPLNIVGLSKKAEINQRELTQALSDMEEEGTVTKLKTRYEITKTGLGIVNGFIEPSADQRLEVIAQLARHPNSSTTDLLRLRSQDPGYRDVVELLSTLDVLRDKGSVERNGHGWVLGKSLLEKITKIIGVPKESQVEVEEVERPKPRTKETKIKKQELKKTTAQAKPTFPPIDDTPVVPLIEDMPPATPVEDMLPPPVEDMPPATPVEDTLPPPVEDMPPAPPVEDTPPPRVLVDPFTFAKPAKIAASTIGSFSSNGVKPPQIKPNPILGTYILNSMRRSNLQNEKDKALRYLKTALTELQGTGIDEAILTSKSAPSEEVIESLHVFFVFPSDKIREILEFCSRNASQLKKATPLSIPI